MKQSSNIKVIYIPGNGGGGIDILNPTHENWIPYVKKELEKLGLKVIIKDWPDPELARAKFWLPHLENELRANEQTILIGWSSGAVAALRYAENHKILGTILVAACYTDLGIETEKISGYFDKPWNWQKIKTNQKWIIQFASTNDPFIPIEEPRQIHKVLNTEYFEMDNQQHFGYPDPKLEFPEIVEVIKEKLSSD